LGFLTTLHSANDNVSCKRRTQKDEKYQEVIVPQSLAIHEYNQFMNGLLVKKLKIKIHNIDTFIGIKATATSIDHSHMTSRN
jgi:hypothetical protein